MNAPLVAVQPQRQASPPPRSKPVSIPKVPAHLRPGQKFQYAGDQNSVSSLSPDEILLVGDKYMTRRSYKEVNPIPEMETLRLNTTPLARALIRGINSLGVDFHGLTEENIKDIVEEVSFTIQNPPGRKSTTHTKNNYLPRTIRYNLEKRTAVIYLKSKGGLPVSEGGFRRGTRAIRITWINSDTKDIDKIGVEKVFQLVTHDDKKDSQTAHKEPFEQRAEKILAQDKFEHIKNYLVRNYDFYSYEKIKKGSREKIKKSCLIVPFYPSSLSNVKKIKCFSSVETIGLAYELLIQLRAFHTAGIIHGDVKAGNILINDKSPARLADYDHTTILSHGEKPSWKRGFYGTYTHTSPELLSLRFTKDTLADDQLIKTDLYALGVELYKLTLGQLPWGASLQFFHDECPKSQPLADAIIKAQNTIVAQMEEQIATYCKTSKDSEEEKSDKVFLMHLIRDLLNPDPIVRLSADQCIARLTASYKVE